MIIDTHVRFAEEMIVIVITHVEIVVIILVRVILMVPALIICGGRQKLLVKIRKTIEKRPRVQLIQDGGQGKVKGRSGLRSRPYLESRGLQAL